MPRLTLLQINPLQRAKELCTSMFFCLLFLPSIASAEGFLFDLTVADNITVSNPDGVTINTAGNKIEFTNGTSTGSITFADSVFNFSIISANEVLIFDFNLAGISINGGGDGTITAGSSGGGGASGSSSNASAVTLTSGGLFISSAGPDVFQLPTDSSAGFATFDSFLPFNGVGLNGFDLGIISAPVITLLDATQSITATATAGGLVISSISTVLNGAHSRPLSRLVAKGEKTGWVAGDLGVDHHDSRNGDLGLAEVGFGYHFGRVQMNIALGKTWSDQDTLQGGSIDADGKFVMVEGIIPVTRFDGLHATITGYGHWGDVDVKRGYLNAGLPDFSTASPDSRTWGLRARLDWQNALSWNSADFTPYLGLSFSDSHLDSFTETGGAFPARFDSRDEEVTEFRVGANSEYPLFNNRAKLLGNLEVAHRFDDQGSQTSGELIGLFGFDLPGQDYDQDWVKAGIGIEGELGKGKASLMLNGTTEGEMPSAWAAFSYQVAF